MRLVAITLTEARQGCPAKRTYSMGRHHENSDINCLPRGKQRCTYEERCRSCQGMPLGCWYRLWQYQETRVVDSVSLNVYSCCLHELQSFSLYFCIINQTTSKVGCRCLNPCELSARWSPTDSSHVMLFSVSKLEYHGLVFSYWVDCHLGYQFKLFSFYSSVLL